MQNIEERVLKLG